jgi:hypothetical protein
VPSLPTHSTHSRSDRSSLEVRTVWKNGFSAMMVCTIWYLWKIGCVNEPEIHQGFLKAGWSLSTDQLAHNYFPLLKAYLRHSERVCLSELYFPFPLWTLFIISWSPELSASSTEKAAGFSWLPFRDTGAFITPHYEEGLSQAILFISVNSRQYQTLPSSSLLSSSLLF